MSDKNEPTTRDDAVRDGQAFAAERVKAEGVPGEKGATRDEILDDARETAKLNHKVDQSNNDHEVIQDSIPANDTSQAAKEAVAKAQLDPNGEDPISDSEIKKSAHNADMTTGNKTAVSNKEAAERAKNPGEAEENAPRSTANPDIKSGQNATSEKVSEASTTNRDQARAGEKDAGRPVINQGTGQTSQSKADKSS